MLQVKYISAKFAIRMEAVKRVAGKNERNSLPLPSDSYEETLSFLGRCLRANAKKHIELSASQPAFPVDGLVPRYLSLLLNQKLVTESSEEGELLQQSQHILDSYRVLVENGLGSKGSAGLHHGLQLQDYLG